MKDEGLVLHVLVLISRERRIVQPLSLLEGIGVVVAWLDVLGDCEDVRVAGSEGAHPIDGTVHGAEVLILGGHGEGPTKNTLTKVVLQRLLRRHLCEDVSEVVRRGCRLVELGRTVV